jgi:hypothetical protein
MRRHNINAPITDAVLNYINQNFITLFNEYMQAGLDASEARQKALDAVMKSDEALNLSERTQKELSQAILEGDSSPLAGQLSVGADGHIYHDPQDRFVNEMNSVKSQLAHNVDLTSRMSESFNEGYYNGALVSFAFDDGYMSDWDLFRPIFEEEDVPGCISVHTSEIGKSGRMDWSHLKYLKELGWTIASHMHTLNVRVRDMTEEEIEYEYRTSHEILKKNGMDYDIIVHPLGQATEESLRIQRKYYKMGINIVRPHLRNYVPYIDNHLMNRVAGLSQPRGAGPSLEECKARVDEAIETGEYIIFEDHSHYPEWREEGKLDELQELIQYVKSKNIPIVNLQDGYKMKCNIIDIGDRNYDSGTLNQDIYKIHRNGYISRSGVGDMFVQEEEGDLTTLIDQYAIGITLERISTSKAISQGLPRGGLLQTTKFSGGSASGYNHQEITMSVIGARLRRVANTDGSWGEWINSGDSLSREYNLETHIHDFPFGETNNPIPTADAVESPSGTAGILVTKRFEEPSSYDWQEYHVYQSVDWYKRYFNNVDGSPFDWVKMNS